MSTETRDTLLHGQLQEGLKYEILKGPAVSGAPTYQSLCPAAKNEEKRQAELHRRIHYCKESHYNKPLEKKGTPSNHPTNLTELLSSRARSGGATTVVRLDTSLVTARKRRKNALAGAKDRARPQQKQRLFTDSSDPVNYLYSEPQDHSVRLVHVQDGGSVRHYARVSIEGVEAKGLVDTGTDITIIGGVLFKEVASAARLFREWFKRPDKTPFTYDNKPFKQDGVMELAISFEGKVVCTPVYIKMDAEDQLLLSEGLCRQLGVVTYHSAVEVENTSQKEQEEPAKVPIVRVMLVESLHLLPRQSALARVELEKTWNSDAPLPMEANGDPSEIQLEVPSLSQLKESMQW